MNYAISAKDREILRRIAAETREVAASPRMAELKKLWVAHNSCRGVRPMVRMETGSFAADFMPARLKCEGEYARNVENWMRQKLVNALEFKDDIVIDDFYPIRAGYWFKPFDIDVKREAVRQGELGHHFISQITDLEADFHKLKPSTFGARPEETQAEVDRINDIFGDILPARVVGAGLYVGATQNLVHIMSMADMFTFMYDYPELFKQMMDNLANDYLRFFRFLEDQDILLPTTGSEGVGQGTYAYNEELPDRAGGLKSRDLWGYCDSQETVGISPGAFGEFIFPYYKRIVDEYGLLSYGCCEPVHPFWDGYLEKFTNMRKVSISAWCDEEFMGERLRGKKIIYYRKPTPNLIGIGGPLDEAAATAHIRKTAACAKGCTLEITQRDVYLIDGNPAKVTRFVEIIRRETENLY